MISSYEVGATLTVADKATPVLLKTMEIVGKLTESFERLRAITTGMFSESGVTSLNRSLLSTQRRIGAVTGEVETLTRGMQGLAAAGAEAAAAMGGIAVTGGAAGAAGGGRGRTVVTPLTKAGGFFGAAAAGSVLYGAYEAANLQSFVARALASSQIPLGPNMMAMPQAKTLADIVRNTATSTGMGFRDTEETALEAMRSMDPRSFAEKTSVLPGILQFAAQEHILKGVSMEEAGKSAVSLAHQLQRYSPEQINEILPAFARLSMAAPGSLGQLTRALSYDLPFGTAAAGVDPMTLMALAASGQQMGLNTKSGTWVQAMMSGLMPHVAGLTSHAQMKKIAGLSALGLVDKGGQSTVWDSSTGSLDLLKALQKLRQDRETMPRSVFAAAVQNAFGTQGGRAAMTWSTSAGLDNLTNLIQAARNQQSPEKTLAELAKNDPRMELNISVQKLTDQMIDLGNKVLPSLIEVLKGINGTLDFLKQHTSLQGVVGAGIGIAGGAWALNKLTFGALGKYGPGLAAGAMGGVLGTEAGASLAALVTTVTGTVIPIVLAAVAGGAIGMAINYGMSSVIKSLSNGKYMSLGDMFYGMTHGDPFHGTLDHPIAGRNRAPGASGQNAGISIQNVHVHMPAGSDLHVLSQQLRDAATRTTTGYGSMQSPYLAGGN